MIKKLTKFFFMALLFCSFFTFSSISSVYALDLGVGQSVNNPTPNQGEIIVYTLFSD